MLGKLIKYDLKFILKSVIIYIVILLICTALFNITSYDVSCELVNTMPVCNEPPIFLQITHTIFWNAIFAVIIGLILNAIIRTWARFKVNLYHDEAYLTHTLPISRTTLWVSKFASAIVVVLTVITSITLSFIILQLTPSGKNLTMSFGVGMSDTPLYYYMILVFTAFTQFLYSTMCGFTGIIIGNKTNNHRNFRAIICGFVVYLIGIFIMLGCLLIWSTFDSGIHAMLFSGASSQTVLELTGEGFLERTLAGISIIYIVLTATLYFFNRHLLNKGVNID